MGKIGLMLITVITSILVCILVSDSEGIPVPGWRPIKMRILLGKIRFSRSNSSSEDYYSDSDYTEDSSSEFGVETGSPDSQSQSNGNGGETITMVGRTFDSNRILAPAPAPLIKGDQDEPRRGLQQNHEKIGEDGDAGKPILAPAPAPASAPILPIEKEEEQESKRLAQVIVLILPLIVLIVIILLALLVYVTCGCGGKKIHDISTTGSVNVPLVKDR